MYAREDTRDAPRHAVFSLHQEIVMIATTPEQRALTHASNPLRDSREGERQRPATSAIRVDRADAQWTVRVVLEADPAMTTVHSVRAIIFDRDSGASVLHSVWSDWQGIPLLAAHILTTRTTAATMEASAASLAAALLALLGPDATACLAALHADEATSPLPGMSRRDRQYRQIVRDATWHDPRAVGGPDAMPPPGRTDMSEAEAAQRRLNARLSGQADQTRGDS
jgi:hypothetical protein